MRAALACKGESEVAGGGRTGTTDVAGDGGGGSTLVGCNGLGGVEIDSLGGVAGMGRGTEGRLEGNIFAIEIGVLGDGGIGMVGGGDGAFAFAFLGVRCFLVGVLVGVASLPNFLCCCQRPSFVRFRTYSLSIWIQQK